MYRTIILLTIIFIANISHAADGVSNLIIPVSYFVNHTEQLQNLNNNLVKFKKSSLVGTSGIGKTQVARTYAYDNRDKYDIIWFIDSNLDIDTQFVKLASKINTKYQADISTNPAVVKKTILEYLKNKNNWLLVFDNLKVGDNYKVQDIIKWEHKGHVLFCSQEGENLPNTIQINRFDSKNSASLAKNILDEADKKTIEFLEESFRGYPILIVQGAQLLNQVKGLDKESYRKKIYNSSDKIRLNIALAKEKLSNSANNLLNKIALINNQSFSKELLRSITDFPLSLEEDIYELTKFALVSNIDASNENPIYEMHDVVAHKIQDMQPKSKNAQNLENVIANFMKNIPKTVIKAHLFREGKTISENLEVINQNFTKHRISLFSQMEVKLHLLTNYVNNTNIQNSKILIEWFSEYENKKALRPDVLDKHQKSVVGRYLGVIGSYYRRILDFEKSIYYYNKSLEMCSQIKGYESFVGNAYFGMALLNITLGRISEAEKNIHDMEKMFEGGLVDDTDIGTLISAKARINLIRGNYKEALDFAEQSISSLLKNGFKKEDLLFTNLYMLKAEALSALEKYDDSEKILKLLTNMHDKSKIGNKKILGRIYTQLAALSLGKMDLDEAETYSKKAIDYLTEGVSNINKSEDPYIAAGFQVRGNILYAKGRLDKAIDAYRDAQGIYFYLYKDNKKYVAQVSELYLKGAMASCRTKDLYHYKCFGEPQIKEFGRDHPNSIKMLDFCQRHNMNLWAQES